MAAERAATMATMIHSSLPAGKPFAASMAPHKAKGSAKTECSHLIISRVTANSAAKPPQNCKAQCVGRTLPSTSLTAVSVRPTCSSRIPAADQRHKPAAFPQNNQRFPSCLRSNCNSCDSGGPTGMIMRPPSRSCSNSAGGICAAAAETMMASKGACSGKPSSVPGHHGDVGQAQTGQVVRRLSSQLGMTFHRVNVSGELSQQGGLIAGTGPFPAPSMRAPVAEGQHERHDVGLRNV